jgi:hypothetical protein
MKTLFEEIMRVDRSTLTGSWDKFLADMDKTEIFYIQNVADYVFSGTQERWEIAKDFPNIAPPFPVFWMEYVDTRRGDNSQVGFLFSSVEADPKWGINSKWGMFVSWILFLDGMLFQPITWTIAINENGSVALRHDGTPDMVAKVDERLYPNEPGFEELNLGDMFIPPMLAVSLLHCKNVDIVSREPKIGNRKQRGRHTPKIRYHTLQIAPMKKILQEEGRADETGIKNALHICRGHFKDFSRGKGLFGKYKDVFWWDSQARGRAERGVVLKDYSVNEPVSVND